MKREGLRISGFAVRGDYCSTEFARSIAKFDDKKEIPTDFEFRNADVRFRDRHHKYGERVDIRVPVWDKKDVDGDPVYSDWIVIASPEVSMWNGLIHINGFVSVYKLNNKKLSDMLDSDEPVKRGTFCLRPEAALDEDGKWLEDIKPEKKK